MPPLTVKKLSKFKEKREKIGKKRGKIRKKSKKKRKNWEEKAKIGKVLSLCWAGYTTGPPPSPHPKEGKHIFTRTFGYPQAPILPEKTMEF